MEEKKQNGNANLFGRGLRDVRLWIGLGFIFLFLNSAKSKFWFTEYFLYVLMIFGLWANNRFDLRKKTPIPRWFAPFAYIFLCWFFGMLYEMSLTVDGTGIGGIHQDTRASFILAQSGYPLISVGSYLLIRYLRLSFYEMFFIASGKSLMEGLFMGVLIITLFSPFFFLTPSIIGYYTIAYSSFVALPLLFIDEELLWKNNGEAKKRSVLLLIVIGFVFAFAVNYIFGAVLFPVFESVFDLPPNAVGQQKVL